MQTPKVKCVVVGDKAVGKTCMLISYTTKTFARDVLPSRWQDPYDLHSTNAEVDGLVVDLALCDTSNQYQRLRPLAYQYTDVFLLCFSVVDRESFRNVKETWMAELSRFCPSVPIILVGTKSDLRDDSEFVDRLREQQLPRVSTDEGLKMRETICAAQYVECCAVNQAGLRQVFDEAVRAVRCHGAKKKKKKPDRCLLL